MKNITLFFSAIIFSLFLSEFFIRLLLPWIPIDIMGAPTVISDRGYTLNPNSGEATQQIGKRKITYHFYPPHLRGTPINPQALHILVLGDSFTFGWLLPWQHTFIYRLQCMANSTNGTKKYQFLNGATGGWGAADYLSYLEEYGSKINPKYVIIFLNTDDIGRAIKKDIYKLKNSDSLILEDNFHPVSHEKVKKLVYSSWLFQHSVLLHLIRFGISQLLHIHSEDRANTSQTGEHVIPTSQNLIFNNKFAVRYGEAFFVRIHKWCITHHAKLLVVTTGFNAFYPSYLHDPTKDFLTAAPAFFKKEKIPFHDSASTFIKLIKGNKFQIPGDQHPNKAGAFAIATANWPWIKNQI